jgi:hypothetical protein
MATERTPVHHHHPHNHNPDLGAVCFVVIYRSTGTSQVAVADTAAADRLVAGVFARESDPAIRAEYRDGERVVATYTPVAHTARERCPVASCRGSLECVATVGRRVLLRCPWCGVTTHALEAAC